MVIDHPIFLESIRFIRSHLGANDLNYLEKKVLERLVHTSGDFSVQNLIEFSEGACEKGLQALKNGAYAGKLVGAGGGGFLLFFIDNKKREQLREVFKNYTIVPFKFENSGSQIIYYKKDSMNET